MSIEQSASEEVAPAPEVPAKPAGRGVSQRWFLIIGAVIVANIAAFILFPPFPKGGEPGQECAYPACFINGTLEFPAPHVVWDFAPSSAPAAGDLITFHPSISSTILTMWIVMVVVLTGVDPHGAGRAGSSRVAPRTCSSGSTSSWAISVSGSSGPTGKPVHPAVPRVLPAHPVQQLGAASSRRSAGSMSSAPPRATSTSRSGSPSCAFIVFEAEGFRKLGFRGYAGKFFPFYEFKHGIGAGIIALFVGLVELMLEFVKPVTLSMRLFGNIYGGEVALGVMTALTIAFIPVGLLRPRADAQRHPGPHLQRADPHVHRAGHREPPRRGG